MRLGRFAPLTVTAFAFQKVQSLQQRFYISPPVDMIRAGLLRSGGFQHILQGFNLALPRSTGTLLFGFPKLLDYSL